MNNNIDHPNAPAAKQISAQRLMQIKAEIAKLKQKVEHGGGVKLALVDRLERYSNKLKTNLASFAETDFIKNLLLQMLKDLDMREEVLDTGFFFLKTKPVFASNHRFVLRNKTRTALSTEALSTTRRFFSCFVLFIFHFFFSYSTLDDGSGAR